MKFRLMSDVHLEFASLNVPVVPNEKDLVLVLAGDVGVGDLPSSYVPFVKAMCLRHKTVIYIPGNHEYYDGSLTRTMDKMKEALKAPFADGEDIHIGYPSNLHFINNEVVIIDDTAFICATTWTNFDNANPIAMYDASNGQQGLNDYRKIRHGTFAEPYRYKVRPLDILDIHRVSKKFLFDQAKALKATGLKTVIVTHHSLCWQSIDVQYRSGWNARLNPCYASAYDNEIAYNIKPDMLVHGHTHNSFDYMIDATRVVCNPRGYAHEQNPTFNPNLILEV